MNTPNKKGWRRIRIYILTVIMLVLLILYYDTLFNCLAEIFHVQIAKYIIGCEIVESPQRMDYRDIAGKLYFVAEPDMIITYEISTGKLDTLLCMENIQICAVSTNIDEIIYTKSSPKDVEKDYTLIYWQNIYTGESHKLFERAIVPNSLHHTNDKQLIVFSAYLDDRGVFVYIADKTGVLDSIPGSLMPKRFWRGNLPFILYTNPNGELCRYDLNSGETINIDTFVTEIFAYILDSTTIVEYSHTRKIRNKAKPEKGIEDIFVERKIDIYTGEVDSIKCDDFTRSITNKTILSKDGKAYAPESRRVYSLINVYEKDSLLWKTWIRLFTDILDFSPDGEMILVYTYTTIRNGKRLEGESKQIEYHILAPNGNYYNFHIPIDKRMGYVGWKTPNEGQ